MTLAATIAVNRFGLGARPGELSAVSGDPQGWLLGQLTPETTLPASMKALPDTADDMIAFYKWVQSLLGGGKGGIDYKAIAAAATAPRMTIAGKSGAVSIEQEYVKAFIPRYTVAVKARFDVAATTERPFFERLVHFWTNHFVVSGAKAEAVAMPPAFERDVIRPGVTGTFGDMLLASTKHPAMLYYLDNYVSVGPDTPVGRDPTLRLVKGAMADPNAPKYSGLNENLAREILELQTVGVRGGYDQSDVTRFAKVISGWTIARPPLVTPAELYMTGRLNGRGLFQFDAEAHEPGAQVVMGRSYAAGGLTQGEAVLRDLAVHPATARFVSTKLARRFVAPEPPPGLVDRMAAAWLASGGDLPKVYAVMVKAPESYAAPLTKYKEPEEFLISAARGVPGLTVAHAELLRALYGMGQPPYDPPGPDGWPDVEAEWLSPDGSWKRLAWADAAASRAATADLSPVKLARDLLGPTVSDATLTAIHQAQSPAQGLTLLLASREFQRR